MSVSCQQRSFDHLAGIGELLGQPRFPKTLDQQLRIRLPAASDIRGYCKSGIALKHERGRFTRLSASSEMGESACETAVTCRMSGVLTKSFLRGIDSVIKTAKLNKGHRHPKKRPVQHRIQRADANGTFKTPDRLLRQPRNCINPASP